MQMSVLEIKMQQQMNHGLHNKHHRLILLTPVKGEAAAPIICNVERLEGHWKPRPLKKNLNIELGTCHFSFADISVSTGC